ncbi:sigma-54-dependent transcriptional regulator [Vibrio metschnikovii]|uniref:sigma-54-dependent transcriptional regulator n=1 Tax=Vibrio metschnikovii TaxID=28172 RepID=UPI001C307738|nr:sigma-54 dependent transcriptional regulator [Vibrio metschnikovii]
MKSTVLLIDDDQDVLDSYLHLMSIAGLNAKALIDPTQALSLVCEDWNGIIILDMHMPQLSGMYLLKKIKAIDDKIPVIVITGHGDIPMAVETVKIGACDFLEKPISPRQLLTLVKQHLELRRSFIEQKLLLSRSVKRELVGKSAQIEMIRSHVAQYALLNRHVVIIGELGCGRHTIAYVIHQLTADNSKLPLVELIGSKKNDWEVVEPLVQESIGGTLLIDDVERLSETVQRNLVQVLLNQERLKRPRTRVIAIISQLPENLIAKNKLLPELYYLLSQGQINVPVLRQRPDDIAALFHYFLKQSCYKLGKSIPNVEPNYLALLRAHQWPGNVRELRNVAELYAIGIVKLTGKERIYNYEEMRSPLDELLDDYEKQVIEDALFLFSGKVADTADYLQVPRKKLYLRMKKHGLEKDTFKVRY